MSRRYHSASSADWHPEAGRGDRLAIAVVDQVAGGEHSGNVGQRRAALRDHVAGLVDVDLTSHELGLGLVADGDERAGDLELPRGPIDCIAQARDAQGTLITSGKLVDHVWGDELDVLDRARSLEHDLRRAELVSAVDDHHRGGELGQEHRLLHRRVATTDDDRRQIPVERRVAGRAIAHPAAAELILAGHPELAVLCAHSQDHSAGQMYVRTDEDPVQSPVLGELDAGHIICLEPRAEPPGLITEVLHQLRAGDPLRKAGVVLHIGRLLEQAAPGEALDHQRLQIGAGRVQRRRVTGGPAADNDHVLYR